MVALDERRGELYMKPSEIRSNTVAKRAFEVAAVGGLRVMLIGPLGTSKSTIREAFPSVESAERETCACGHFQDPTRPCSCKPERIARWVRRLERDVKGFDIVLEACATPVRDMIGKGYPEMDSDTHRGERIRRAVEFGQAHTSMTMDDAAMRTVEMAARRLAMTNGQYGAMLRIARAIANLDASDTLKAKHVAEACQYSGACMIRSLIAGV
jgi:predicted ATPase with chaperone activity